MTQVQGLARILLDDQNRDALLVDIADLGQDVAHHARRKAGRRLVEEQNLRIEHQRPGERKHLALAPGELAALM